MNGGGPVNGRGAVDAGRRVDDEALLRLAARVAAPGTPAERLVRVVAWYLTPGRTPNGLRTAVADRDAQPRLPAPRDGPDGVPPGSSAGGADDRPDAASFDAVLAEVAVAPVAPAVATVLDAWVRVEARAATVVDVGATVVDVGATVVDHGYPVRLAAGWPVADAPPLLAWRGPVPARAPAVAIVGARTATAYGSGVAAWLAEAAGRAGVRVVSGGARGIDAAAHLAALDTPGGTTVVLGCGHTVRYPRPHAEAGGLFERVVGAGGGVVSEQLPFAEPHPGNIRARNRIVARLVDAVVVVEGSGRSGALVTANAAADAGVPVLAVPGDVRAPGSVAPHRLLAEGAAPCTSPADLLDVLGAAATTHPPPPASQAGAPSTVLPAVVRAVLVAAWPRPVVIDDLAATTDLAVPVLLGALTRARIAGETTDGPAGVRLRRAPPT